MKIKEWRNVREKARYVKTSLKVEVVAGCIFAIFLRPS